MIVNTLYGPDHNGDMSDINDIHIRWREEGKRVEKTVKDFEPYCYVPKSEKLWVGAKDNTATYAYAMQLPEHQNAGWMVNRLEPTDKLAADGAELVKVILNKPWMARVFARRVKPSFEADVPYEDRYLIDNVNEINSYKMRKLFIDLEALQYRDGDKGPLYHATNESNPRDFQEINVIGAYDSFSKQRVQWCQHASFDTRSEVKEFDGDKVLVYYLTTKRICWKSLLASLKQPTPIASSHGVWASTICLRSTIALSPVVSVRNACLLLRLVNTDTP